MGRFYQRARQRHDHSGRARSRTIASACCNSSTPSGGLWRCRAALHCAAVAVPRRRFEHHSGPQGALYPDAGRAIATSAGARGNADAARATGEHRPFGCGASGGECRGSSPHAAADGCSCAASGASSGWASTGACAASATRGGCPTSIGRAALFGATLCNSGGCRTIGRCGGAVPTHRTTVSRLHFDAGFNLDA